MDTGLNKKEGDLDQSGHSSTAQTSVSMFFVKGFAVLLCVAVSSTVAVRVNCKESRLTNSRASFDCISIVPLSDLIVKKLYVLWLKSHREGGDQTLDINVPNYHIDDVIQAAAKGGDGQYHTSINVKLDQPQFSYTAQKEERIGQTSQSFDVNFEYQTINGRAVHFADEGAGSERYTPLKGSVQDTDTSSGSFTRGLDKDNDASSYATKIVDLFKVIRTTFGKVGDIAVEDNREVGAEIVRILSLETARAAQIVADFNARTLAGGRFKRQTGKDEHEMLGSVLAGAKGKIAGQTRKLKPEAQKGINSEINNGLAQCSADSCKSAKANAGADDKQRQG